MEVCAVCSCVLCVFHGEGVGYRSWVSWGFRLLVFIWEIVPKAIFGGIPSDATAVVAVGGFHQTTRRLDICSSG